MKDHSEIRFLTVNDFAGWDLAPEAVKKLLQEFRSKRILEIGSGARPTIPIEFVKGAGLEYTTNDVSESELTKADPGYKKLLLDMGCASLPGELTGRYDFIFSRMVNEHVKNGENYYRNIHAMLAPGGITVHWFSTLYALPFLMNWLLPDKLSDVLLSIFASRDRHLQGKFVAHYSWCRGPSPRSIRRFEEIGFKVLRYNGYFGHSYYARRLQFLDKLEKKKMTWLARHPQAWACSYAHIILQHPAV